MTLAELNADAIQAMTPEQAKAREYVSIEEACKRLGNVIKPKTVRNKIYRGDLGPEQGVFHVFGRIAIDFPVFERAVVR